MPKTWLLRPLETAVLAVIFALGYRFPGALGGWPEPILALLFPMLLMEAAFRGRNGFWIWLSLLGGFVILYHWVPGTLVTKGGLPWALALVGGGLLNAWEALGLLVVVLSARWMQRRSGAMGAACVAALGILLWETWGFHVYAWHWGSAFGALPWTARAAAFLGTRGLSAMAWGLGAWTAGCLVEGASLRRTLAGPGLAVGLLALLGGAWYLLPRDAEKHLDVAMVQPNFPAGVRWLGMENEMWQRSDALLNAKGLPRPERATLLLWPESSVLGRDDRRPDPRLKLEASRRHIAWLFGTEGGLFNLVRGEVADRTTFLMAKIEPMAFGERMPGPEPLRRWLDHQLGFVSQEPGELREGCAFLVPAPTELLRVHPLICSDALLPERSRRGLVLSGADLLTNHTNDGWFESTVATDLHAAQIRLRATELGVPLVRATLTGKSGLFREDGHFELWGKPMSEGAYAVTLDWRPVHTPARSPWLMPFFLVALGLGTGLLGWGTPSRKS